MRDSTNSATKDAVIRIILNNKALLILILLMVISQVLTDGLFLTTNNISSVSRQVVSSTMLGIGFTVVLASGGVDLSVGHMLSFVGMTYAISLREGAPLFLSIVLALLLGAVSGLLNGLISEKLKLVPFIVTLATAQVFRGFASLLSDGQSIPVAALDARFIGQGIVWGIPLSFIITILLTILTAILIYRTKFGRHVIATGGNPEAANVSGINISRVKMLAFVIMGVFAAVAAIILTGRVSMAQPAAGAGMEMDAIAAVVIGGTPMSGGKARVFGTVFGCLVIGVMSNLLNLTGVSSFWQWVSKGVIIILAIVLDAQTERIFRKQLHKK
jgi:ribose/xylose/arabinose/galactoside ABC-type transport system permease subunit